MDALVPINPVQTTVDIQSRDRYDQLMAATLSTVAPSSARIYRQTFQFWKAWCTRMGRDPLLLMAATVAEFLVSQSVSQSTRQRQLSALRKMARVLATLDYQHPARRAAYESLLLLRVPKEGITQHERVTRALSPTQAIKVLGVWHGERLLDQRNQALVAVLLLTGLRRSEAVALQWTDLNFEEGTALVRHGKGDVTRSVAIAGEAALAALKHWQTALREAAGERVYVFCAVGKGNKPGPDAAMTDQAVYYVVKQTEKASSVVFSPHDARRTFITEALATGTTLADVQAQAGHKRGSTTLRYAQPVEARQRRQRLRLRYGDE